MADVTMNSVTIPNVTPAGGDLLLLWDASAGANGECSINDLIALLQATFATLSGGNTLTGAQTVTGTIAASGAVTASLYFVSVNDNGTGAGPFIRMERNNSASTPAPASVVIRQGNNAWATLWPDNSGVWRTAALPSGVASTDIATGTVVGAQTSSLDAKEVTGEPVSGAEALASVVSAAQDAIMRFVYKGAVSVDEDGAVVVGDRPYNGEEFSGIVVDFAPRYGMDADDEHPYGRSLNVINAIGDLMLAVDYLASRVAALEAAA